ncbi:MAG: Sec-independent protein translocase protein TatB [Stellaceae bacterium]
MLFDLGMSELLLIGVVALIVVGPKDLPKALRVAGYWVKKARTLSREFQSSVEQMIREAELDEMRQELKKATEIDLEKEFRQTIDPTGSLAESLQPPELPNFRDPEPAATPAPETVQQPEMQPPPVETPTPEPAVASVYDAAADPPQGEPSVRDVAAAQAGGQGGPLARE